MAPCLKKTPMIEIKSKVIQSFLAQMTTLFLVAHLATCLMIRSVNPESGTVQSIYTTGLYFLITTSSTTGYGDITVDKLVPNRNDALYVLASLVILFGLNYFVIFIAYNKVFIEDLNLQESIKSQAIEEIEDWFAVRNQTSGAAITWEFEKLVKGYHNYLVHKDIVSKLSYGDYYDKLPFWVQQVIQLSIANDLISAFEIFKDMHPNLATQIAIKYSSLQ